ncbi:MAG: peptidoglycan-binding protein, partial [Nitrospinota bacterium]
RSRSSAWDFPVASQSRVRGASPPPAEVAPWAPSGSAAPPPLYRTASAAAGPSGPSPSSALTAGRPRAPLRVPLRQERLTYTAPAVRPVEPGPSFEARAVRPEPPPAMYETAPTPPAQRQAVAPTPRTPSPVRVTPALIREVQRRLKRQGYPVGRVDGRLGRQTTWSIRRFQRDVSLHPTGRIDRHLLTSLGIGSDSGWSRKPVTTARLYKKPRAKPWKPTRAHVKEVQRRLALIGYRPGPADGLFGRQTARAVKDFQRQVGLKPTGRINRQVLHRLSIKP